MKLSREREWRITAQHECAHAVIHWLAGAASISLLRLKPAAALGMASGLAGECKPDYEPNIELPIYWIESAKAFGFSPSKWSATLTADAGTAERVRNTARAVLCGLIAGPIMDSISYGGPTWKPKPMQVNKMDDVYRAHGLANLLSCEDGSDSFPILERFSKKTLHELRKAETREAVASLATALMAAGELHADQIKPFLPTKQEAWLA